MTDYKALCAELTDRLQHAITSANADSYYGENRDAVDRARTALAQPGPEGVTDEEVPYSDPPQWCNTPDMELAWKAGKTLGWQMSQRRYARPTIKPGPEDCDAKGRCWVGCPEYSDDDGYGPITYNPSWELATFAQGDTHWLPHHALPVPTTH